MHIRRVAVAGTILFLASACASSAPPGSHADSAGQHQSDQGHLIGKPVLRIGVKIDLPGLSETLNADPMKGFDIDVAEYVARGLGAKRIQWIDVTTNERAKVIQSGEVDLVVAAYVINEQRLDQISFAGPYAESRQDILVRTDEPTITGLDSLRERKTCTVTGATSGPVLIQHFGEAWDTSDHLITMESLRQCVNALLAHTVDAVSSGNIILVGYAAELPGRLRLVGRPFTYDDIGIGLAKGDTADILAINRILRRMISDGSWAASVRRNFGKWANMVLANPPNPVP